MTTLNREMTMKFQTASRNCTEAAGVDVDVIYDSEDFRFNPTLAAFPGQHTVATFIGNNSMLLAREYCDWQNRLTVEAMESK